MCPHAFHDDGKTLRLDVHGCTISEAMRLVRRCLEEGHRRGRFQLEVITGHSTTTAVDATSIKNALTRALEKGDLGKWVTGWFWSSDGGRCVIAQPFVGHTRPERIRLQDITPR